MSFQSTPPIRGETLRIIARRPRGNFNPLPSYEGRLGFVHHPFRPRVISIHSPHTRGDTCWKSWRRRKTHFNPLPSHEGRRKYHQGKPVHARFQSTPLTRGETLTAAIKPESTKFQSTPLTRGETRPLRQCVNPSADISIHSPHTRGDYTAHPSPKWAYHFNPLPSHEGRHALVARVDALAKFQSTPLIRGETR